MNATIYSYIQEQENKFQTDQVQVADNWYWNFRDHVQLIFHLKNGVFSTGANDYMRAFQNVMEPILNLNYWTEDIEAKDVFFYIEEDNGKVLSFLVKKYYDEVYVKTHDIDALFDAVTEADLDYGGVLLQKGLEMPEVIKLPSIAFCDQTDILGGPLATKLYFSPDKLRSMSKYGWGDEKKGATVSLSELATLATATKDTLGKNKKDNVVPGKIIEVYIVRGSLPEGYLKDNDNMEDHYDQIQIVGFYTKKDSTKEGVTLYRKKFDSSNLKFFTSKEVYMRALGRSVGESLIHPQIWTNFLTIHKMSLLEAAAKVPLYTDDDSYTAKNKIQDMESLEITTIGEGKRIGQIPTAAPANIQLFTQSINGWYEYAQVSGAAFDPLMGKEQPSGGTFRGQERTVAQGQGIHNHRRGKRAKFLEEVYRDMILPDIKKEILKGQKFLAQLSTEELTWVADTLSEKQADERVKQAILNGQVVTQEQRDTYKQMVKGGFLKKGNKHLIEILKGEFEDIEIKMGINIAAKQKDMVGLSDKLLSIFQFIFANPQGFQQAMQIPALANSFENLLEFGGMSIADFSSLLQAPPQAVASPIQQGQASPASQAVAPLPLTPSAL